METTTLNQEMALPLLGGATSTTFPDAQLLGCGPARGGIYFDFEFPFEFNESFLTLIQESLSALLKEEPEAKEMVPFVAHEYFQSKGFSSRAESVLEEQFQTVTVLDWNQVSDYVVGDYDPPGAVKISGFEQMGDVTRIYAMAGVDRKDANRRLREAKEGIEKSGRGEALGLYRMEEGLIYWLPEGLVLREQIIWAWKQVMHQAGFAVVHFPESDDFEMAHAKLGKSCQLRMSEGSGNSLWDAREMTQDWAQVIVKSEEVAEICNFILQLRQKISTILGLEDSDDLLDAYGRAQPRCWVEESEMDEGLVAVEFSLLGEIEKIAAWLIENGRWKLKFED